MSEERLPLQSPDTARQYLFQNVVSFRNLLPDGEKGVNRFMSIAVNVLSQKPDLLRKATRESVFRCLFECARLRLEPEGTLGHAYLIPYKNVCTVQVGYKGFCQLAYRVDSILKCWCRPVFEGDEFREIGGAHPDLIHVPAERHEDVESSLEHLTHAYACVKLPSSEVDWEVMNKATILKIKGRSSAWDEWPVEMAKIRPLKRLLKRQRTTEKTLADGVALDDREGAPRDPAKEIEAEVIEVSGEINHEPFASDVAGVKTVNEDADETREEINAGIEKAWTAFHTAKIDTRVLGMEGEYADYLNPEIMSDAQAWRFRDKLIREKLAVEAGQRAASR